MKKIFCIILAAILCFCLAACAQTEPAKNVDLTAVMEKIRTDVELPEMMDLNEENLLDYFGIEPEEIDDFAVCINANGYEKEEIILLKASNAQAVDTLVQKLNDSLENAATEMQNYLPQQYALIQQSHVRTHGLYVTVCVSENASQIQSILDSFLL